MEPVIREYHRVVEDAHADLTLMDRRAGDGDFGDNLRDGLRRVVDRLDAASRVTPESREPALAVAASVFLDEVGGTSGPLFGLMFAELARAGQRLPDPVAAWREGLAAGLAAIQRVGEAEPGDRTLVDALVPAIEGFAAEGTLSGAARGAADGARATSSLRARRGRASYVGDRSVGVPDPGAVAVALLLISAARVLEPGAGMTAAEVTRITAAEG
ncbi:dihydroxyacetone kinase subunit DhaL [Microbispora sp. KK1-11]|uniref:dihydroxyacetone kinase subunit DhaL n=1 Tax=Microbispora sp. KK1-11 TaxID=2053005 RepID=UPI0021AFF915|nr:dihydroxyacetone kinase subunit DhaL [Microbispora sp. KK1-11]